MPFGVAQHASDSASFTEAANGQAANSRKVVGSASASVVALIDEVDLAAAKVLVEGLRRAGRNPTRERLRAAMETFNHVDIGGLEGEVHLAVRPRSLPRAGVGDPEVRLAVAAVADGDPVVHLTAETQHAEDGVVELLGLGPVTAVDAEVVDHAPIVPRGTDNIGATNPRWIRRSDRSIDRQLSARVR